jgi:dTMP kinase
MKPGKLIVIDGTDGCGKATQTKQLVDRLKEEGRRVFMLDFPRYGQRSATLVEDYLNGKFGTAEQVGPYRASIFYAGDRFAASEEIRNKLNNGEIGISNRYVSANMGHQSGKIKNLAERDRFLAWLEDLEYVKFGIPRPDQQVLLYADPEVAQKLVDNKGHREYVGGKKRDIHEADINHLKDAANAFLYCAEKFNWTVVNCSPNGTMRTPKDIGEEVYQSVISTINS